MEVAIDIDGPLVTCRAVSGGLSHEFVALTTAFPISGSLPAGRVTYAVGANHFGVRELENFRTPPAPDDAIVMRVRVQDAVLRVLQNVPGDEINVTLGSNFQQAFAQEGEDLAEKVRELSVARLPTPAPIQIERIRSLPRTVAAFLDWNWIHDETGRCQRTDRPNSMAALYVDIGPLQTTIARLSCDDESVDPSATRVLSRGWVDLAHSVEQALRVSHGMGTVRPSVLANILMTGGYRVRGKQQEALDLIDAAATPLLAEIKALVGELGGNDPVIVVGLPALRIATLLRGVLPREVLTSDAPAFANVRGLLKYASEPSFENETP